MGEMSERMDLWWNEIFSAPGFLQDFVLTVHLFCMPDPDFLSISLKSLLLLFETDQGMGPSAPGPLRTRCTQHVCLWSCPLGSCHPRGSEAGHTMASRLALFLPSRAWSVPSWGLGWPFAFGPGCSLLVQFFLGFFTLGLHGVHPSEPALVSRTNFLGIVYAYFQVGLSYRPASCLFHLLPLPVLDPVEGQLRRWILTSHPS